MKTANEIIAEKYSDLVKRWNPNDRATKFTEPEKATWFIVTIGCEIAINSLEDVFVQCLTRSEVESSIGYLKQVQYFDIAGEFEKALKLLVSHGFYLDSGYPSINNTEMSNPSWVKVQTELTSIGERVTKEDRLWNADNRLLELYQSE